MQCFKLNKKNMNLIKEDAELNSNFLKKNSITIN
jgi:hypothetical protein